MALRFASFFVCTLCMVGFGVAIPAPPPPPTGQCGPNSERRICGSACAATCANPFPGPLCVLPCIDGCFCSEGYLKSANGSCVLPEQCEHVRPIPMQIPNALQLAVAEETPQQCGANEEFRTCGPICQPACHMPRFTMFCSLRCSQGCFCKEGYIRNEIGECIPLAQCPTVSIPVQVLAAEIPETCGENEEYRTCGPFCQPSCHSRLPMFCSLRCKTGCFCKEGHLRNQEGKCAPKSQCQPLIIEQQQQQQQQQSGVVSLPLHGVTLRPGSGPLHRFTIPPASLPSQNGPINIPLKGGPDQPRCHLAEEEFHFCGVQLNCLASCTIPMTPECMERTCTPGCRCRDPLVRDSNGRCVEKAQCPKTTPFQQ